MSPGRCRVAAPRTSSTALDARRLPLGLASPPRYFFLCLGMSFRLGPLTPSSAYSCTSPALLSADTPSAFSALVRDIGSLPLAMAGTYGWPFWRGPTSSGSADSWLALGLHSVPLRFPQ